MSAPEMREGVDCMTVYLHTPEMVQAFRDWLRLRGHHASGPVNLAESGDDPNLCWFVRPGRSPEEFESMMRAQTRASQ